MTTLDDAAVRAAVVEAVVENGYLAVTFDEIAGRLQVTETALRERWHTPTEMVFSALINGEALPAPPDLGSLAAELALLVEAVLERMQTPASRAALPFMLAQLSTDDELRQRFLPGWKARHLPSLQRVLDRAVRRDELQHPVEAEELHAQLIGTLTTTLALYPDRCATTGLVDRTSRAARAAMVELSQQQGPSRAADAD